MEEIETSTVNDAIEISSSSSSPPETFMVGFLDVDVVAHRHYQGTTSCCESVELVRDESNPNDQNAIKVFDMRSVQVGHLEPLVAAVLSPLIDAGSITIEGIVPKPQGKGGKFKIQVHIFAKIEEFEKVKQAIATGGLQLISENNASFTLSEAMAEKEKKGVVAEKSVDAIFKLLDLKNRCQKMLNPLEPPKEIIKSELFPHQKEGLGWLVSRENSCDLPPFWEEKNGVYVNALNNYRTDTRPEPLRGGIFADDMGLGKTLTFLSLIAFDKWNHDANSSSNVEDDEKLSEDESIALFGKKSKRGRGAKRFENSREKKKVVDINANNKMGKNAYLETKTTLIICPPSILSSWKTQLEEHTQKGTFKVYEYYGLRTKNAEELQNHDIVLTTYGTLASEKYWTASPIKKIEWRRVILDEAHVIKNEKSQLSCAVAILNAKRRWAVTGTPVQNNSFDLFPLVAFLKVKPLSIKSRWNSLIQDPLAEGDEKGFSRLQVLMAAISLRRTKDKCSVDLPSKSVEICFVELREEERRFYDQMEEDAKNIVKGYISDNKSVVRNYSTVLTILLRLRQICTDLHLCPADLGAVLPSSQIEDVKNNPTLLRKLLSVLQDGEDFNCPICISPATDIVITCCAHIFCELCILKSLKQTKPACPLYRQALQESDLFKTPPESSGTSPSKGSSSKERLEASQRITLLIYLRRSRDENPSTKSIIFSQFGEMLLLLEEPLKEAGFKVVRLDGLMDAKRRGRVIKEFGDLGAGGPTILLASLKASNAGINLTAASRVYLMEPWWNPAVEEQAMDRVHRIGQKDDVKIVRLIARNSIEERILQLQKKKRVLAKKVFVRKGSKDQREINRDDLRVLMNLE
ncbi:hypothetical protein BUALT_Bualt16G0111700 [Buddleja alternifolia]|uniref:DNA/RNA helicase protein n=1 Tax=Buddleja alternifolia TaxID=168488 RepID=A0AAV6WAU1_9LAMI|nr:hypothetical protein BUALT_Bualt16G0111700 [Buddleja alternifolia]